jgi:hypothetical protein
MNVFSGYFRPKGSPAFRVGAVDFLLPIESYPAVVKPGGANYYFLGVRPEDLSFTTALEALLVGQVTGLEHRGFDCVVNLSQEDLEIKAIAVDPIPDWDETAYLKAPRGKFFVFDSSGQLLVQGL